MSDDTLIADLVRAGVAPELIARVASAITGAVLEGIKSVPDRSGTSVRAYEAARKQAWRENKNKINDKPEANDAGQPVVSPATMSRTVPDNRCDDSFFLSSSKSLPEEKKKKEVVARARGTRLEPNWQPTQGDLEFAQSLGLSAAAINAAVAEFVDYWIAVPGQRGTKMDWSATWRNRARQLKTGKPNGVHHGNKSLRDAGAELLAEQTMRERTFDLGPDDYDDGSLDLGDKPRR